ncbi:hypothetical protein [Chryseobacterium sp.]|jgi:hypothetical protein|nr:hypothetical protein [Chryseobacterium sp.]
MTKANVESKATSKSVQVKAVVAPEQPSADTGWTFVTRDFIYTHD